MKIVSFIKPTFRTILHIQFINLMREFNCTVLTRMPSFDLSHFLLVDDERIEKRKPDSLFYARGWIDVDITD
jgi:hypothetical protein